MKSRPALRTAYLEPESDFVAARLEALAPRIESWAVSTIDVALERARAGEVDVLLVASHLAHEDLVRVEAEVALVILGEASLSDEDVAVVLPASPLTPQILELALRAARDRWLEASGMRGGFTSDDLFESLPVGVAVADLDDRVLEVNSAAGALVGTDPAELRDRPSSSLVPSRGTTILKLLKRSAAGETSPTVRKTKRLAKLDGTSSRAQVSASLVHDADGKPIACVRTFVDVTESRETQERLLVDVAELRKAEEAARRAEQFLEAVLEQLPAAVHVVLRPSGAPLLSNGRFRELLGAAAELPAAEQVRLAPLTNERGEAIAPEKTPLLATIADGLAHGSDALWLERGGARVPVSARAAPLQLGDRAAAILVIQDLTELRLQELLRKAAELRQSRLFEQASDAILFATSDLARIVEANPAALALFRFTRDEIARAGVLELSVPTQANGETAAAFFAEKVATARRLGVARFTWLGLANGGRPIELEVVAQVLSPGDGSEVLALQARDVTSQRMLEEELRTSQKLEAIGLLAGGIAHDFNNLLSGVVGFQQLALETLAEPGEAAAERARRFVDTAHRSTTRAIELASQLLTFSRKSRAPSLEWMDVRTSVERAANLIRPLVGETIRLVLDCPAEACPVRGIPAELEEVLVRLAVNARDAMPQGGTLTVATRRAPGDKVLLEVLDTGVGMTEDVKRRVFEPFFTTKTRGRGTGMGLAVSHGIVRRHGGRIFVESRPGAGSRFSIELPACLEAPRVAPVSVPAPVEKGKGESILVVDDDALVRDVTAAMLVNLGYRVETAGGAAEALHLCVATSFDLVVSDVVMPETSGIELARQLRRTNPRARILMITGYAGEAFGREGPDEAFLATLPLVAKPLSLESLGAKVREVLASPV